MGCGGGVVLIKEDRFEALAHVPFDMVGEHTEEDMGAHPPGEPVVDRANVEVDGLEAAKGSLDPGETLIGSDGIVSC